MEHWNEVFEKHEDLLNRIYKRINKSKVPVYPSQRKMFKALEYIKPRDVKVVLLGLDPYHQPKQAIGFSFAVSRSTPSPPSLRNILKELKNEGYTINGNQITRWVRRGVLLLNAYLTVEHGKSKSYQEWRPFTIDVMKLVLRYNKNCVFLLLGRDAQSFIPELGDANFVTAAHPSPLSAHNGFFGSDCFKEVQKLIGGEFTWDLD